MIIKKIELENIRSHVKSVVEFSRGVTVFTGRTGCGKSTILMAVEYALFGSGSNVSNSSVFRRNCQKGSVVLEFEENGDIYRITRGIKKQGKTVAVDSNNLSISRNSTELPLLGRASDLNQKILEILGYPEDISPKDLFETTSYTRQDEIRALVQMSNEKRQEHIDKILQLSKYRDTWDNMKDVLSFFTGKISEKRVRIERLEALQEELIKIEKRVIETEAVFEENNREIFKKKQEHKNISAKIEYSESELKELLEKRRKIDLLSGIVSRLKDDVSMLQNVISAFEGRIAEFRRTISELGETSDFEMLQTKNIELLKEVEIKRKELDKIKNDFEKIKKLGKGKCPSCLQQVTPEHLETISSEFASMQNAVEKSIKELLEEQQKLEPEMRKSRLASELKTNLETNLEKQKEKNSEKEKKEEEFLLNQKELNFLTADKEDFSEKENALNSLKAKEKEIFSAISSTEHVNQTLSKELEYLKLEFKEKKGVIDELEQSKESVQKLESAIEILSRLREDIRNIREIIRRNFLEDFRQEFQKKFEEIRRYEEEYSVDIKQDYEPVAFTSAGEEVQIANLSGGEKTSVALAYRLALADLAAQMSSIRPSEILILDEPTTGFDQEDVKSLPPALRNIKTIPQIIIVTHEEELKNAADYKFEVQKESGISTIKHVS